jgi:hypothetical protein
VATAEGGNGQKGRGVTEWTCGMRRAEESDDGIMHWEGISKLVKGLFNANRFCIIHMGCHTYYSHKAMYIWWIYSYPPSMQDCLMLG